MGNNRPKTSNDRSQITTDTQNDIGYCPARPVRFMFVFFHLFKAKEIKHYPPIHCMPLVFTRATLASAGTSYSLVRVCLSICPCLSVRHKSVEKGMNGLMWFSAWRLLSTSLTLCFKEIQVSTKIRALPSGSTETFFLNSGFGKFRHGISIFEHAINLAGERWTLRAR